jgi:PPK2 family polyphosphate:nucleotide phosphotransferase
MAASAKPVSARWLVKPGRRVDLSSWETSSTAGAPGDKRVTKAVQPELVGHIDDLQERLWAEGERSLLLVLQAMDGGGKDGTIEHVLTGVNPQGVRVSNFKRPSELELAHDFLWRIHQRVPARGEIGVFNRSHYEDVVVVRVKSLVPEPVWRSRFEAINEFEALLTEGGTRVVKVFLHISADEQARRLRARVEDPTKHWKFHVADLEERKRWEHYMTAYGEAIERTSTAIAPWYVIPADRKWYRNWAVSHVVLDALRGMDPQFPEPEEDLEGIEIT